MISLRDLGKYFGGSREQSPPNDELEITDKVSDPTAETEPFLAENNMGLGVLDEAERYQQLQGYYDGLYGHAALARTIEDLAIEQAKRGLLEEADLEPPEDFRDSEEFVSVREWREAKRDEVWQDAQKEDRFKAIAEYAGLTRDWLPSHWRMNIARTEFSRSQDGRLLGDTMGRTREIKTEVPEEMKDSLGAEVRS